MDILSRDDRINKLQVNLSSKALKEIDELKTQIDASTRTQVIKSSLKVLKYLEDKKGEGGKIIIRDSDGNEAELLF